MPKAPTTESQRIQQLRDIITEILGLRPGELTATSDFLEDHYADSLTVIDLQVRIQREMGVLIPNEALPEMVNLNSVIKVLARYSLWDGDDLPRVGEAPAEAQ